MNQDKIQVRKKCLTTISGRVRISLDSIIIFQLSVHKWENVFSLFHLKPQMKKCFDIIDNFLNLNFFFVK